MSSMTLFIIFVSIIALLFLIINFVFAPHNPYQEKDSIFECGFHSFLGQNRTPFITDLMTFALLFLLFDLEVTLLMPYSVSAFTNSVYGLIGALVFISILTIGLVYELGKGALNIDSKQTLNSTPQNIKRNSIKIASIGSFNSNSNFKG